MIDEIEVDSASPMADRVRLNVARLVYGYPSRFKYAIDPGRPIRISVQSGHVTLYGVVDTDADEATANIRREERSRRLYGYQCIASRYRKFRTRLNAEVVFLLCSVLHGAERFVCPRHSRPSRFSSLMFLRVRKMLVQFSELRYLAR